jgi:LysM repeat protein
MKLQRCWFLVLLLLILSGCGRYITPTPSPTASATATAVSRQEAAPTATPRATPTPRAATPIATNTPTVTPTPVIYTIQSGDTLLKIALQFNITTEALEEANGIIDPRLLQIGQTLIIPPAEQNPQAGPSPSVTPYPVLVSKVNLQETRQKTLWCLGTIENPGEVPVAEVVVEVSLFDPNGVLLLREAAYTQLDVILPGESAPFAVLFEAPPDGFAQYQVIPVSAVPLAGDTRYYFELEATDLNGRPEGIATYRIDGQLRNTGTENAEAVRLVAVAYDADDRVLAQRQANLDVNILRAGATTPFQLDLIIPAGSVDHYTVIAQGLRSR